MARNVFSVDPVSGDFCRRISDNGEWFELTPPQRNTKTILEERSYCVLMVFEMIYLASQLHLISIMSEVHT